MCMRRNWRSTWYACPAMSIKLHCLVTGATSGVVKWLVDTRRLPHLHACPLTSTGVMRASAPGGHALDGGILVIASLRAFECGVQSLHATLIGALQAGAAMYAVRSCFHLTLPARTRPSVCRAQYEDVCCWNVHLSAWQSADSKSSCLSQAACM